MYQWSPIKLLADNIIIIISFFLLLLEYDLHINTYCLHYCILMENERWKYVRENVTQHNKGEDNYDNDFF